MRSPSGCSSRDPPTFESVLTNLHGGNGANTGGGRRGSRRGNIGHEEISANLEDRFQGPNLHGEEEEELDLSGDIEGLIEET